MRSPAFLFVGMMVVAGCHAHSKPKVMPTSAPAPIVERIDKALVPPAVPEMPVKQGVSPLVYIVERGGDVRIVEVESGKTIAAATAGPRSIVSIVDTAGVRVGDDLLVKGPLPEGRTYQIFIETQGENVMHNELVRPGSPVK